MRDISGEKFGRLTAISKVSDRKWLCRCDCGSEKETDGYSLIAGKSKSCGCLRKEMLAEKNKTHGLSKSYPVEYRTWKAIRSRCYVESSSRYYAYGARGIKVDPRWNDFEAFLLDMGPRPSQNHSIDRIDVNGNYSPENCKWSSASEQSLNKRTTRWIVANGRRETLTGWSIITGIDRRKIAERIDYLGWSPEKALELEGSE